MEGTRLHKILATNEVTHHKVVNSAMKSGEDLQYLIEQQRTLLDLLEDKNKNIPSWVEEQYRVLVLC